MTGSVQFSSHPLAHIVFDDKLKKLVFKISKRFDRRRIKLLSDRQLLKAKRFIPQISSNSEAHLSDWRVASIPARLMKRDKEVTAPANVTKTVIQMFNRNEAGGFSDIGVIDFEDSMKPSFDNVLLGYINCIGVVKGDLEIFINKVTYQINSNSVYPVIKIRGLHLEESNITVEDEPTSASLMDLAITSYLTILHYKKRGLNLKYYIPKIESILEAKFWNDVLKFLEEELGLEEGEIKISLLIETYPAICAAEEILFEVKDRATALCIDHQDMFFSDIKIFGKSKEHIFQDSILSIKSEWMEKSSKRVINICQKRGAIATGEINRRFNNCRVNEFESIEPQGGGPYSFLALRGNVKAGISYLFFWNKDIGSISLEGRNIDLAVFEISRAQVWQWNYHRVLLDNYKRVDVIYLRELFDEVEQELVTDLNDVYGLRIASEWCFKLFTEDMLRDFFVSENLIYDEAEIGGSNLGQPYSL